MDVVAVNVVVGQVMVLSVVAGSVVGVVNAKENGRRLETVLIRVPFEEE